MLELALSLEAQCIPDVVYRNAIHKWMEAYIKIAN